MTARRHSGSLRSGYLRSTLLALTIATSSAAAHAADPKPVTIAAVSSRVQAPRLGNVVELVRSEAESQIASIDWKGNGVTRRVSISATIVELSSAESRGVLLSQATVSAAVLDGKTGALLAMVQGKAQAEGGRGGAAAGNERDALKGAVRGAIGAIPEAIRRMK